VKPYLIFRNLQTYRIGCKHCIEAGQTGNHSHNEPFDQALITLYPAFDIGTLYLELQQVENAIAAFNLALSFDPNYTPAKEQLAIIAQQHPQTNQ
jgi:Tfp pilus assembly protein PilF